MLVLSGSILDSLVEQNGCSLGVSTHEGVVTNLSHHECLVVACRSLAVECERILAFVCQSRVEAEQVPVTSLYSFLLDLLSDGQTRP